MGCCKYGDHLELKFGLVCGFKMMDCSRVSSICVGTVN